MDDIRQAVLELQNDAGRQTLARIRAELQRIEQDACILYALLADAAMQLHGEGDGGWVVRSPWPLEGWPLIAAVAPGAPVVWALGPAGAWS